MKAFIFTLTPPHPTFGDMSDAETATMRDHVAYWRRMLAEGSALAFGPALEPGGLKGYGIILAEDEAEAERLRVGDPAYAHPGFVTTVAPFMQLVSRDETY